MSKVNYLTSKSGFQIPALGLGTWQSDKGQVRDAVKLAIDIGIRHIDCAYAYFNESEVGEGIEAKIADKTVQRSDLFLTSKLWNTYHRPDLVKKTLKKSLDWLKLDYLDLYLIHWPMAFVEDREDFPKNEKGEFIPSEVDYLDTWKAMEALVDEGLCKAIGISNFNSKQIQRILDNCRIAPANLQIESSAYLTNQKLIDFAKSNGITVVAYSPLGSPTRPWAKPEDPLLLEEPLLKSLGEKYGKSPAQILIRFQLDRGIGVVPKSVTPSRIRENFDVLDFSLSKEEIDSISAFNRNFRAVPLTHVAFHKDYPFHEEF